MVKYSLNLDHLFGSLADPTRRDILRRVATKELSVSDIAVSYRMSLPAISKHLKILENAKLVVKRRQGKQYFVQMIPEAVEEAASFLNEYKRLWEGRLDSLEAYLKRIQEQEGKL